MEKSLVNILNNEEKKLIFFSVLLGYLLGTFAITQKAVTGLLLIGLGLNASQTYFFEKKLNHWVVGLSILVSSVVLIFRLQILPSFYGFYGLKTSVESGSFNIISNVNKLFIALSYVPLLSVLVPRKALKKLPFSSLLYLTFLYLMLTCGILIGAGLIIKYIKFDFTFPGFIGIWAINMAFICFSEEVFFRGILQNYVISLCPKKSNFAVFLAAIIFGLFHFPQGEAMVFLAFIAGLFYGFLYKSTQRLWCPIMLHFGLNFVHFIFFSYPRFV